MTDVQNLTESPEAAAKRITAEIRGQITDLIGFDVLDDGKAFESWSQEMAEQIFKVIKWRPVIEDAVEIAGILNGKHPPYKKYSFSTEEAPFSSVSISTSTHALRGVLLFIHTLDLRDATEVLRLLRKRGYKMSGSPDEFAAINAITWVMTPPHEGTGDVLKFRAFLRTTHEAYEEPVCSFVQTGVKEEPVYEIRCGSEVINFEEGDDD
jgi:hypothetical protein